MKPLVFGEVAETEESQSRLVINARPDAVYPRASEVLIFRNPATISSIFPGSMNCSCCKRAILISRVFLRYWVHESSRSALALGLVAHGAKEVRNRNGKD
jgi:hypothetical protein